MSDNICQVAVIGGGIAGLATAVGILDQADQAGCDLHVTVFEANENPGGNLRTMKEDGWQLEYGPNGFMDSEPATLRLVERLGLTPRLRPSSDATRRRFLMINGRMQEIPTSPKAFLRSKMLPVSAKLRMFGEMFIPGRKNLGQAAENPSSDETVYDFGVRRLGREFAEVMLDPMVKGVFGGDARELSLAAAFPRMVELEKDHGGLFRAMIALFRKRKGNKTDAGPSGKLTSFQGGMADLINALTKTLEESDRADLRCGSPVETITHEMETWRVSGPGFNVGPFSAVVQASPAHAAATQLAEVSPKISASLAQIPFAPMAVVAIGFDRSTVKHDLDGFGLLVPSREKRDILGCLWTSSIFPGRAPKECILLRAMLGGASNPKIMELDDEAIVALTLSELRHLLGLRGLPKIVRVIRYSQAIAQYHPGHLALLRGIDLELPHLPGLYLTGSSYRGIAVNSCVKEAENISAQVIEHLASLSSTQSAEA